MIILKRFLFKAIVSIICWHDILIFARVRAARHWGEKKSESESASAMCMDRVIRDWKTKPVTARISMSPLRSRECFSEGKKQNQRRFAFFLLGS